MSLEIGRFTPSTYYVPPAPAARPVDAPVKADAQARDSYVASVPATPPRDVKSQVDRAAEIAKEMNERNRELHFSKDEKTGRVVIEVRDLDGNVIKTIPPSHALNVMAGVAKI
jgi:flagellar protein FlaG